ncbi:Pyruvate ferredoxin/flavodoxin oxidoreductase, beta subunit [Desulfamplus magnetovallimortis]|uniref:Pyruvate ferredoxin/flavodoxin oxidoreductase, beta subunit n=1 Tax=Desulfamplus magnetovallimortis TaxID=1246637 RepID=A0A1W1H870_9BACT|nr:2-oxoacid:ferredoxin oxidoreductase subunit beta [Desulfamplus magnetovallimortis]SLM28634.1 Pyruvate ferredoxin/flavodoxin oxidoreductase, beta subunit [Desulfamplus magnetovallimortis]
MVEPRDYDNDFENKWCPGCGNFLIQSAMKQAFAQLNIPPEKMLFVSGIGQAGKTPHFMKGNMFHSLHGRALPVATGAKCANHDLNIVVNSGDGDCYGEGGNHFLAAVRRNIDILLMVHNNQVYGLTKGQASPTSALGMVTKTQKDGVTSTPFNPLATAIAAGAGFVARSFSGSTDQLVDLIKKGMAYKGFALIDILQPCVSFNKINTHQWYKERVYDLDGESHDPSDISAAFQRAMEWGDKIPTGIIYEKESVPFHQRVPVLKEKPLIAHTFDGKKVTAAFF